MQVRIAKNSDIEILTKLDKEVNLTPWSDTAYTECLNNKQQQIYVLLKNGKIIGCVVFSIVLDESEILQFWISKNNQTNGLGKYLLTYLLDELRYKFKVYQIFLEVRENNTVAIGLYSKMGFVVVGHRNNYYKVGSWQFDAIVMQKQLVYIN